jgi:hypothetical protein
LPGAKSGSICAFNMLGADGRLVPYSHVEELASVEGISLRTGAFCNPGAVQEYLGASSEDVAGFIAGGKVHITTPTAINHTPPPHQIPEYLNIKHLNIMITSSE